jgi:hypothetical protein
MCTAFRGSRSKRALKGLKRPDGSAPYIFQEVIDQGGERVRAFEYAPNGDVTWVCEHRRIPIANMDTFRRVMVNSRSLPVASHGHGERVRLLKKETRGELVRPAAPFEVALIIYDALHLVTQPYQRWLGVAPSSRYAILIWLR